MLNVLLETRRKRHLETFERKRTVSFDVWTTREISKIERGKCQKTSSIINLVVFFILVSLIPFKGSLGEKITQRFGGSYPKNACRLMYLRDMSVAAADQYRLITASILDGFRVIDYLNCSKIEFAVSEEPLAMLPNGTYTSTVGYIQRNEADILTFIIRPDSLPHEPGIIGPELFEADASIMSARVKSRAEKSERQLLNCIADFPIVNYAFILITTFIFVVMYLIMEHRNRPLIERISTTKLLTFLENASHGFVDHINLYASRTTGRILLGSFLVFLFFVIYGMFLSKIGADMVTVKEQHEIEKIEEVLENDDLTIVTIKEMYLNRLLDTELKYRPESLMAQVKRKMNSNPKAILDVKKIMDDPQKAIESNRRLIGDLVDNTAAFLQETPILKHMLKLNCLAIPGMAALLRTSQVTYAPGTLNVMYSYKIDPKVRRVFDYYIRVQREGSLIDTYLEAAKEIYISMLMTPETVRSLQCKLQINETLADMRLGFGSFRQITIKDYEVAFLGMGCAYAFSFLILVAEILRSKLRRKCFRKKNRVAREKSSEKHESDEFEAETTPTSGQIQEPVADKKKEVTSMKRPKTSHPKYVVDENVNRSAKTITRVEVH